MISEVPAQIQESIQAWQPGLKLRDFRHASGGCINNGGTLETTEGSYFLKWNDAKQFPGMFNAEMEGLKLLGSAGALRIPEPVFTGEAAAHSFLLMEQIDSARRQNNFFDRMGEGLANLHRNSSEHFGLDHSNYIGSLPQDNGIKDSWPEFFMEKRLEPQLRMARDSRELGPESVRKFHDLYPQLENLFPSEPPALLHGDLWSGNYMVDHKGEPCLIDPAVYFGHREMDIAMTQLFGGFDREFYNAYNERFPMEPGWQERMDLCNLYPLLVHVNLFGGGYMAQVNSIMRRFV